MANSGKPTARNFYCHWRRPRRNDGKHTAFGKVINRLEVVDAIQNVATDKPNRRRPLLLLP